MRLVLLLTLSACATPPPETRYFFVPVPEQQERFPSTRCNEYNLCFQEA